LRLKDVARIELGAQTYEMQGKLNGKPAAGAWPVSASRTNAINAVDGVKKLMKEVSKNFPQDLEYVVSLDTTEAVREGISEIIHTLVEALILVIIVVFIFLQGWRATLIPALAVPGLAHRHLRLLPGDRVLDQHDRIDGYGARHRSRC